MSREIESSQAQYLYALIFMSKKICMRTLLLCVGLLLSTATVAQVIDFPVRCDERILTPRVAALCGEHRSATREAEERYLFALSRVDSVASSKALQVVRGTFMVSYHLCAIRGTTVAVAVCLTPAFEELLSRLPGVPLGQLFDLKPQARNANALVLSQANDAFNACTVTRIKALDDGVSPARDIAMGVGVSCRPQALDVANIQLSVDNTTFLADVPTLRDRFDLAEQLISPDQLVTSVLEYRAQKRSKTQQPKKANTSRKVES